MEKVVNFRSQSFFKLEVNGLPDTQKSKVEKVSQLFKMLSDPTRLKILLYLKDGGTKCDSNHPSSGNGAVCCIASTTFIKRKSCRQVSSRGKSDFV